MIGESARSIAHVERAVDVLRLLQVQWAGTLSKYAAQNGEGVPPPVRSLADEAPFPEDFGAAATYALAAGLLEGEDETRAQSYRARAKEEVTRLLEELPAHVHAIVDVYG
jgi:hypothetical protein